VTRVWLSGAGGFVGHHCLEHLLVNTDWDVVATDSFRHHGKTDRLADAGHFIGGRDRVTVVTHDLTVPFSEQLAVKMGRLDYMIAMASESHVDRSITDPVPFVMNNVAVILNTLELARRANPRAVIVVSTDEVYGPVIGDREYPEWSPILPSNPYSASKAAQEAVAIAYWRAYGVPVIIVNIMNVIGERQSPEKYLPMLISRISRGEVVKIHGRPPNVGSRHYLHARNASDAMLYILQKLPPVAYPDSQCPDRYNVGGQARISNLALAVDVAEIIGAPLHYETEDFGLSRRGHDPHYGLDMTKLTALGWVPPVDFREGLEHIVRWTLEHPEWLLP
jgi:dTDP-glucose 4,6-dehydratase